jgi:chromosome segregation protein
LLIDKIKNPKIKESHDNQEKAKKLATSLEKIHDNLAEVEQKIKAIQNKISSFNQDEEEKNKEFFDLQKKFQSGQYELNELVNQANELKVELARLETKKEDLEKEIKEELGGLEAVKDNKKNWHNLDAQSALTEIQQLKHQLELIGGIDPEVQQEFGATKERHDFLFRQVADLKQSLKSLEQIIRDLDEQIKKQFDRSFSLINTEFQKYFKILFHGGKAQLIKITVQDQEAEKTEAEQALEQIRAENTLINQTAPEVVQKKSIFDQLKITTIAGVEIQATPPGKKVKSINMLSGGERAMTAIALICAIISCNPSPFIVLDEVDAALDEANSERFSSILDELSHKTQFVIVTHNRATMHRAKILYGVTMGADGASKLLSLKLEEAEKYER